MTKQATPRDIDVVCFGRSSIDLYSNDIGAKFEDITNFAAYVGGCPTNIAVGTRRLGLRSALITAVGADPVGDFVLNFLNKEQVDTRWVARKGDKRTSAVVLGIEPPSKFPLVFYRENCADINLTIDDVADVPIERAKVLLMTGTALSREPSRTAAIHLMERAKEANTSVVFDLDFRADQWQPDLRAYGVTVRSLLPYISVVLGTEEELRAVALRCASQVSISDSQISAPVISGDTDEAVSMLLRKGASVVVVKRGADGSSVYEAGRTRIDAEPFRVEVCNVLGAGDAFASGFIYGLVKDWELQRCARMGNATGAILVTKHGCANFMPTEQEALAFIAAREEIACRP
jgi:5-dehydro-2-deoxygluconokinase